KYTHGGANASLRAAAFNPVPTTTDGCLISSTYVQLFLALFVYAFSDLLLSQLLAQIFILGLHVQRHQQK
ncbi:hypothetical protein Tco_1137089, partial [Tanacetum coccineum]